MPPCNVYLNAFLLGISLSSHVRLSTRSLLAISSVLSDIIGILVVAEYSAYVDSPLSPFRAYNYLILSHYSLSTAFFLTLLFFYSFPLLFFSFIHVTLSCDGVWPLYYLGSFHPAISASSTFSASFGIVNGPPSRLFHPPCTSLFSRSKLTNCIVYTLLLFLSFFSLSFSLPQFSFQ